MKLLDFFKNLILTGNKKNTKDIAIDLGTANTIFYVKGEGIVIDEPTYVAVNIKTDKVDFIGEQAKKITGRTAQHTQIIRPLKNGVISNYEITEKMLSEFLKKIQKDKFNSSRVIICIPSGVTQVERKAVVEVVKEAGAKEVHLIEEPVAAALGAGIDLFLAKGHLIVDIGGGTTEIASIVSGGSATSKSIKVAGDHFNEDIIEYVKNKHNLLIGENTAEELKIQTLSAKDKKKKVSIRGRELGIGLPKNIEIVAEEMDEAINKNIETIIDEIKIVIEEIEPETAADIYETGIYLSGGGAEIRLLKEKIESELKIKVIVCNEPLHAVVRGISLVLDDFESYSNIIISSNE